MTPMKSMGAHFRTLMYLQISPGRGEQSACAEMDKGKAPSSDAARGRVWPGGCRRDHERHHGDTRTSQRHATVLRLRSLRNRSVHRSRLGVGPITPAAIGASTLVTTALTTWPTTSRRSMACQRPRHRGPVAMPTRGMGTRAPRASQKARRHRSSARSPGGTVTAGTSMMATSASWKASPAAPSKCRGTRIQVVHTSGFSTPQVTRAPTPTWDIPMGSSTRAGLPPV
jgi:hypothetical protein